ncbi:MAG: ABC transporter ATP-binding protein [Candidatus Thermoplasmatota archaeon]|nr:ABC transporter ATP-binding protein [Candidatus Thermoplasmatota archaeon]
MIECHNLSKIYSDGFTALNSVSFSTSGRINTLIGRNGAGKTTLTRILSTQLLPTSGTASINGLDIHKDLNSIRRTIVSIPQEASPLGILTALEQVSMFLVGRGNTFKGAKEDARIALEKLGLHEFRNEPADKLSGGMKRKIFVAMAIASGADTVFLDEPTTGLDPVSRIEVWSAIREIESEIFLTTHYMEEAEDLSENVYLIDHGNIKLTGTVRELLKQFDGKVRIESRSELPGAAHIGLLWIGYANSRDAEECIARGCTVKPISLDDVFLSTGASLES